MAVDERECAEQESVVLAVLWSSTEADWEKWQREPAERFSGRMGPFSGSDQVSAVVKLSLFGRKNSKHEPVKAAHPSACILNGSGREIPHSNFCGFFRFHSFHTYRSRCPQSGIYRMQEFTLPECHVFKVLDVNPAAVRFMQGQVFLLIIFCCVYCSKYFASAIRGRPLNVLWVKPLCSSHLCSGWYAFVQSCQSQVT